MSGGSIAERQQALLVARLQAVLVSNGYLCDMGARVYEERAHFDEADTFPLLNVQMVGEAGNEEYGREKVSIKRTFRVEIYTDDSFRVIALLQDVKRAVMDYKGLGKFTDEDGPMGVLSYGGTEQITIESDGKSISGLSALFTISGQETWGEPRTST